jgi:glutamate-5-semialdehyde dehydrogenase
MNFMDNRATLLPLARAARDVASVAASLSTAVKNEVLRQVARELDRRREFLKEENGRDLAAARQQGMTAALYARLTVTDGTIDDMIDAVYQVATLNDPVGEVVRMWRRPNELLVGKVRIPLGVIGIIYESRPNVTLDAAALCFKSGNAVILKGGKEAHHSNRALAELLHAALRDNGLPEALVQLVPPVEREELYALLALDEYIDLIIPRGGEELIRAVVEHSKIPVIKHYKGLCHIFVDESADQDMAESITLNAKVQKPGVCNALETLLIHRGCAAVFLPRIVASLRAKGVEIRACRQCCATVPGLKPASEEDWYSEYLDLILSIKIVADVEEAIAHIARYGSLHTDAIITRDYDHARTFLNRVNSSVVLVNASTRFNDGNQLGLGAEIGISTTKLHAFGPMGLEELTTLKYVVYGSGQIRTT